MAEKKGDWFDKLKRLAEKTEDLIDRGVDKLNEKGVPDKIERYINKAEDYVGKKVDQFKQSEIPDKVDEVVEKTDKKIREVIRKTEQTFDRRKESNENPAKENSSANNQQKKE